MLGKKAEQYEPQNPYYNETVDERGKKTRTKRPLPEGLTPKEQQILTKVRRRAYRLDKGFTICGFRFGWTFFIALIPILGDLVTFLLGYMLVTRQAKKLDVPASLMNRMRFNSVLATACGFVPLAGDIIMAVIKANSRNAFLLEEYLIEKAKANPTGAATNLNHDVEAQRVLNRASEGNWSSRTGRNDAFASSGAAAPAVPPRMGAAPGRTQAQAPPVPARM